MIFELGHEQFNFNKLKYGLLWPFRCLDYSRWRLDSRRCDQCDPIQLGTVPLCHNCPRHCVAQQDASRSGGRGEASTTIQSFVTKEVEFDGAVAAWKLAERLSWTQSAAVNNKLSS